MAFRIVDNVLFSFDDTEGIKDIHIPEGVKKIEDEIIRSDKSYGTVFIPSSVESISENAFKLDELSCIVENIEVDDNNPYFTSVDGCLY